MGPPIPHGGGRWRRQKPALSPHQHCFNMASVSSLSCSSLSRRPAGYRRQRSVAARAGFLDTLIKPITSSGEVGEGDRWPAATLLPPPEMCRPGLPPPLQRKPLNEGIGNFYDESSQLWESMWVSSRLAHHLTSAHPMPPLARIAASPVQKPMPPAWQHVR
jgi:hypothetical protein